ncbi:hypothetical protein [Myroides odoratus]|uniref:Uncharacterized protein n=1 Tax=Myroides odoratus TaxID=256 RepID=A0A378RQC7_MYROD|nr:hypothetical protein [Myroides odoratus]QQU04043.1 hypothetical protein I6I89_01740 [Myroides odoratus]STZ28569.1 Uncharacterised protein [Myroides odoratus]
MRRIEFFYVVIALLFGGIFSGACSSEGGKEIDFKKSVAEINSLINNSKDFNDPIMGYIDDKGMPVLTKDKNLLLKNWNENLLFLEQTDAKLDDVNFIELDGDYFLQAKSASTDYISTIGAFAYKGYLYGTTTSCTTKGCSNNKGCIPDGVTCTSCILGDCSKTVTSAEKIDIIGVPFERDLAADFFIKKGWKDQIFWEYKIVVK